jgi:hypothetical protein
MAQHRYENLRPGPEYLAPNEIKQAYGIHPSNLANLRQTGRLKGVKTKKMFWFKEADIAAFRNGGRKPQPRPRPVARPAPPPIGVVLLNFCPCCGANLRVFANAVQQNTGG